MKIYLFFVNDTEVIEDILGLKYYPDTISKEIDGIWYTLFAWTTKKKYRNAFFQIHKKKYFYLIEKEIIEKELNEFYRNGGSVLEIGEYEYENINHKIKLVTTAYEFDLSQHLWIDLFSDNVDKIFSHIPYIVTETLQFKYQEALYKLGVNALLLIADDELSQFIDNLNFSLDDDYILNIPEVIAGEKLLGRKVTIPTSIAGKTLNSFIHLFKGILTDKIGEV